MVDALNHITYSLINMIASDCSVTGSLEASVPCLPAAELGEGLRARQEVLDSFIR